MNAASSKTRFAIYGYLGFAIIVLAEVLLFGGNRLVGHWFTPIVWTGYILFIDALVYNFKGKSLLMTDRLEVLIIVMISIGPWWLCKLYTAPRFCESYIELRWHYHTLQPNPCLL